MFLFQNNYVELSFNLALSKRLKFQEILDAIYNKE